MQVYKEEKTATSKGDGDSLALYHGRDPTVFVAMSNL